MPLNLTSIMNSMMEVSQMHGEWNSTLNNYAKEIRLHTYYEWINITDQLINNAITSGLYFVIPPPIMLTDAPVGGGGLAEDNKSHPIPVLDIDKSKDQKRAAYYAMKDNTGTAMPSDASYLVLPNEEVPGLLHDAANGGGDWTGRAGNILTVTGGTFGALKTTVTPGDSWLGNNGKYYSKNWGGNQYTGSRAGAYKAAGMYRMAGRANVATTVIVGGVAMYNGYQQDGGTYGQNFHRAGASTTGGLVGGFAGAKAGAAIGAGIGVWFGGVGAVPGAVIGGFIGGLAGSITGGHVGGVAVDYYYE